MRASRARPPWRALTEPSPSSSSPLSSTAEDVRVQLELGRVLLYRAESATATCWTRLGKLPAARFADEVDVWVLMAGSSEALGLIDDAVRYYDRALTLAPDNPYRIARREGTFALRFVGNADSMHAIMSEAAAFSVGWVRNDRPCIACCRRRLTIARSRPLGTSNSGCGRKPLTDRPLRPAWERDGTRRCRNRSLRQCRHRFSSGSGTKLDLALKPLG